MKRLTAALFLFFAFVAAGVPALAQTDAQNTAITAGEVRKIDPEAGKLTIRHGPIANLDMAAMTMAFRVKEGISLSSLKAGDKIRFIAERINGSLMVTFIEMAE